MRHASLALAVVIPFLLACPGDDQGGETGASPPGSTGAGTTAAMGSSSAAEPSTGPGGATTSAGSSGPPGDGSSSGGGTSPLDACVATCERLIECGIERVPNCGIPCAGAPAMAGGCESEYVAQQECAAALSCEDLQAWTDAMMVPGAHPCEAEDDAYGTCEIDGG